MTDNTPNQSQPTAQQPLQRDAIYARLRRTIRIQWAVLAIALLLIIHVTTSLFEKRGSTKFNQPIESPLAVSQIGEFRNDVDFRKKVRIIWYEPDQITGYMSGFFKAWTDAHELPKGQRWVVGFYPMRRDDLKKEDGEEKRYKNRVDFLDFEQFVA